MTDTSRKTPSQHRPLPDRGPSVDRALLEQVRVVSERLGHWVAINKPPGLPSVPAKDTSLPHAVTWLTERYLRGSPASPAISPLTWPPTVHRLDMDTSGLLLLALNPDAQRGLSAQFEARLVGKRYVAVVRGRLPDAAGVINTPIRADWARRPVQVVDRAGGRDAVTRFRVLAELADGTSRVELEPLTGRSHQLRLHLASVGCPIVGDPLYGPHGPGWPGWQGGAVLAPEPQMAGERAAHQPGRMLLHASGLAFTDPLSGEPVRLHCEPEF